MSKYDNELVEREIFESIYATDKNSKIQFYKNIDLLISDAYKYVSETNGSVLFINSIKYLLWGFKKDDGNYLMGLRMQLMKNSHELYSAIIDGKITPEDFINKQMKDLLIYV